MTFYTGKEENDVVTWTKENWMSSTYFIPESIIVCGNPSKNVHCKMMHQHSIMFFVEAMKANSKKRNANKALKRELLHKTNPFHKTWRISWKQGFSSEKSWNLSKVAFEKSSLYVWHTTCQETKYYSYITMEISRMSIYEYLY